MTCRANITALLNLDIPFFLAFVGGFVDLFGMEAITMDPFLCRTTN